ncbi:MAG: putative toxin-antitoxin system toxin component, PIN family [Nanoarchaeota archaeon]
MRVVIDTNVFIFGIFWEGSCNKIILLWKDKKFEMVSSLEILDELSRVLKDFKIQMPDEMIKGWIDLIINNSLLVEPEEKINLARDEKDNMFIEAAVSGNADYIVSQDNHLLELKEFRNIKMINPENFLNLFL